MKIPKQALSSKHVRLISTSSSVTDEPDSKTSKEVRRVPFDLLNFMESPRDKFLELQDAEYLWDTNCVTIGDDGLVDADSLNPLHGDIISESCRLN